MALGWVMVALGIGSAAGAFLHFRASRQGKPPPYPLLYDLLGAVGFLAFGIGTLGRVPFFTGSGRWWLLVLLPVAVLKWWGVLRRR